MRAHRLKVGHAEIVITYVLVVIGGTRSRVGGWLWFDDGLHHHPAFVRNKNVHVSEVIDETQLVLEVATSIDRHVADCELTVDVWKVHVEFIRLCAFNEVVDVAVVEVLLLVISHWMAFRLMEVESDPVPLTISIK